MNLNFEGILLAICTFLIIGLCHPLVIKTEYYFGTKPWILFLILGIVCVLCSMCISHIIWSSIFGVLGASFLWSIGELFEQKKIVEKGWFPRREKNKVK